MFARQQELLLRRDGHDAPILKIFVPHTGQVPCVAGRPFFIVIAFASLISREALHFTQYPVATGSPPRDLERDAFSGTHTF